MMNKEKKQFKDLVNRNKNNLIMDKNLTKKMLKTFTATMIKKLVNK